MDLKKFQDDSAKLSEALEHFADACGSVDSLLETSLGTTPWKLRKVALSLRENADRVGVKYERLLLKAQGA